MRDKINKLVNNPISLICIFLILIIITKVGIRKTIYFALFVANIIGMIVYSQKRNGNKNRLFFTSVMILIMVISLNGLFSPGKHHNKNDEVTENNQVSADNNVSSVYLPTLYEEETDFVSSYESYCSNCNNTGICPYCDGTGKKEQIAYSINLGSGSTPYVESRPCTWCSGSGRCTWCSW